MRRAIDFFFRFPSLSSQFCHFTFASPLRRTTMCAVCLIDLTTEGGVAAVAEAASAVGGRRDAVDGEVVDV